MDYFAYGSNINLLHLATLLAEHGVNPDEIGHPRRAVLRCHRLRTNYYSSAHCAGACNVEPDENHHVEGVVMAVTDAVHHFLRGNVPDRPRALTIYRLCVRGFLGNEGSHDGGYGRSYWRRSMDSNARLMVQSSVRHFSRGSWIELTRRIRELLNGGALISLELIRSGVISQKAHNQSQG